MPRSSQLCSKPVRFQDVSISSDFWASRLRKVRESSLPAMYQQMKETGRWDCLKLQWKPGDPNKPHRFWDSDIAKWLEAACYILTLDQDDEELSRLVESAIDDIRGAQQEDGYINSYYTVVEPERKWADIAWSHELYCAGHLLEAGLAHYAYSGSYRLLGPLLKYIKCIDSVFGPDKGKKRGYPGHEEIEIALTRAYEITDDDSLLKLAHYFITERGTHRPEGHYYDIEAKARGEPPRPGPGHGPPYSYHQADRTIREMGSVEGHSVRAMYWLAGAAGVARLTNDNILREAVERLWESTTHRKMYITGGLGAIPDWEGFGPDYYLPNESGYLETCAAIALVFFAHQMILLDPMNMEYAHVLELALYNAVLVGVSLDGKSFFYDNPLATIDGYSSRKLWFEVACCPANTARLIGSVGNYVYSIRDDDMIFVHLYISSTTQLALASDNKVIVRQKSNAPWHGGATFTIESYDDVENVSLCFRIPRGCEGFNVSSSTNVRLSVEQDSHLLATNLKSRTPVTIVVSFKFKPRRLFPHPLNLDNRHGIAIARGPLIYCAETTDNLHIGDLRNIRIPDDAAFAEEALDGDGLMRLGFKQDTGIGADLRVVILKTLAQTAERTEAEKGTLKELTLIPYFMWANRGKSNLRVWLPRA